MNSNLLCADSNYLIIAKDYRIFNNGVITYQKLLNAYMENNCSTGSNNVNITMLGSDYIPGKPENATGALINLSCNDFRTKLIEYTYEIYKASISYESHLKTDFQPHIDFRNKLLNNYIILLKTRTQLDRNVQKILAIDNTPLYEKQNILDSAVFTTLLWTVLATSALYYAFTKI